MPAPFLNRLLGRRNAEEEKNPLKPNFSDGSNLPSVRVANHMLETLGIDREVPLRADESAGALFEKLVRDDVEHALHTARPDVPWDVRVDAKSLSEFAQYAHLEKLKDLVASDDTKTLATALGQDYEVQPDVTVGLLEGDGAPFLHASISCKFTIRSDRAQNAKTESAVLTRHRKGRMPHVVALTAEPLPLRIASLAQGTGDLDAVYHVALDALQAAVGAEGSRDQRDALELLTGAGRLLDYDDLLIAIAR